MNLNFLTLKFMFSKKATKIDEIFTVDLTLHNVKSTMKLSSFFVAFSENKTWTLNPYSLQPKFISQSQLDPKYPKTLVLCRKNGWIMENHELETSYSTYLPKLANYLKYFWKKLLSHVHCLFCFVASHVIQYVLFKDI